MTGGMKKQRVTRFREDTIHLARRIMTVRKATTFSDYLRGLILLDACELDPDLAAGLGVPSWLTTDKRYRDSLLRHKKVG